MSKVFERRHIYKLCIFGDSGKGRSENYMIIIGVPVSQKLKVPRGFSATTLRKYCPDLLPRLLLLLSPLLALSALNCDSIFQQLNWFCTREFASD